MFQKNYCTCSDLDLDRWMLYTYYQEAQLCLQLFPDQVHGVTSYVCFLSAALQENFPSWDQ